ncbi:MAG: sigma-54-dependent Fis family transcriptional regulator [Alphaproteobacteria bacterium]|nr:MAG: sigma-54-dependent Fis family transcriptional regulator [Alphaproteobacteria bacterium]
MAEGAPLLLVEDTPSLSMVYETILRKAGYQVATAFTSAEARAAYDRMRPGIVLLDLLLPDGDGRDILRHVATVDPGCKVIVITANGSVNRAVEAMREGAFDFLVKPFDDRRLLSAVGNAVQSLARNTRPETGRQPDVAQVGGFIGSSPAMREVYRKVASIGRSTATVFITGESGTGKELCAQAIHAMSNRARGPFVPLNCGAIPADLLESEVFGHLRGSFTGAIADKVGAAAAADGGTLFLDEICEMDLTLQTKLLRFLQTSMIQPVGAVTPRKVDVRIVCATNRDPMAEVRAGRFREDLFYRLHVMPIHLPPLRARGDDVNEIAERMLAQFAAEEGKHFTGLAPEVRDLFRRLPWPGNVRQLLNVLRNVVVLNDGPVVHVEMLPPDLLAQAGRGGPEAPPPPPPVPDVMNGRPGEAAGQPGFDAAIRALVGRPMAEIERHLIEATIAECAGSIPRAARLLDLSPSTIYRKREAWARGDGRHGRTQRKGLP